MGSNRRGEDFGLFNYRSNGSDTNAQPANRLPLYPMPIQGNRPFEYSQTRPVHMSHPSGRYPHDGNTAGHISAYYPPSSESSIYRQGNLDQQTDPTINSFLPSNSDQFSSPGFLESNWMMETDIPTTAGFNETSLPLNAQDKSSLGHTSPPGHRSVIGQHKRRRSVSKEPRRHRKSRKKFMYRQELTDDSITHCQMWLKIHPFDYPPQHKINGMAIALKEDPRAIETWYRANVKSGSEPDSAYATLFSSNNQNDDLISAYRKNQRKCLKPGEVRPQYPKRGENHRYACTSGCNRSFSEKGDWKRHEERNFPQKLWRCPEVACRRHRIPFFERNKLKAHLVHEHGRPGVEKEQCDAGLLKITESKFPRTCIFRTCSKIISSWRERLEHLAAEHFEKSWDYKDWRTPGEQDDTILAEQSSDESEHDSDVNSSSGSDVSDNDDLPPGPGGGASGQPGRYEPANLNSMGNSTCQPFGEDQRSTSSSFGYYQFKRCMKTEYLDTNHEPSGTLQSGSRQGRSASLGNEADYSSSQSNRDKPSNSLDIYESLLNTDRSHIQFVRRLGHGSTAVVDEVRYGISNSHRCVRKMIQYANHPNPGNALCEVSIMQRLNHPHVVKYITSRIGPKSLTIFMEPVADHTLSTYLSSGRKSLERSATLAWLSCLASGLQHIHRKGMTHGDIKPSNIIVRNQHVLLADFGLSKSHVHARFSYLQEAITSRYAAPEMRDGRQGHQGQASDVFSLGCVFSEMLALSVGQEIKDLPSGPYATSVMSLQRRISDMKGTCDRVIEKAALDACAAMTQYEPGERPKAYEIASWLPPNRCCNFFIKNDTFDVRYTGAKFYTVSASSSFTSEKSGAEFTTLSRTTSSTSISSISISRPLKPIPEMAVTPCQVSQNKGSIATQAESQSQSQSSFRHDQNLQSRYSSSTKLKSSTKEASMLNIYLCELQWYEAFRVDPNCPSRKAKPAWTRKSPKDWTQ